MPSESPRPAPTVDPDAARAPEAVPPSLDSGFSPPAGGRAPGAARPSRPAAADGFDLCHVGLVLRVVLYVEAVLAIGILFVADDLDAALLQLAVGSAVAMPAVLAWLAAACTWQAALGRCSPRAQWAAAAGLGAVCAWSGWALVQWAGQGVVEVGSGSAALLAGAFLGVQLMVWLQLRSRSQLPADTTARLAELQSRIRPHFLFNTLNSALGLVHRDPVRAEALLEDLSELFRSALADGASAVSLDDEIDLARRYLAIEQTRFGERLQVEWQLDPAAGRARVPPLLLQPLVENAVRHGIEPSAAGGRIRIRTQVALGQVRLSIVNSLPPAPELAAKGHGIALQNVRERLRLMHDLSASFDAQQDATRFKVQILLPL
jgi:two-component system sensor histidine kinase AlgZ